MARLARRLGVVLDDEAARRRGALVAEARRPGQARGSGCRRWRSRARRRRRRVGSRRGRGSVSVRVGGRPLNTPLAKRGGASHLPKFFESRYIQVDFFKPWDGDAWHMASRFAFSFSFALVIAVLCVPSSLLAHFVHAARAHYGGGGAVAYFISIFLNVTLALCVFACFQTFSLGFKLTHQPQERFVSKVFETSQAVLREGLKTPTLARKGLDESFEGCAVLTTNLQENIDEAFLRRFGAVIEFPMPSPPERYKLWERAFPAGAPRGDDLDLQYLAKNFVLAGGAIVNSAINACIMAAYSGQPVGMRHAIEAVARELYKNGQQVNRVRFGEYYDDVADLF